MHKVAVLVGSLREGSHNRALAKALAKLGKRNFTFDLVPLDDLPLYNEDLWKNPPESVLRMKATVEAADAVLFVTPEYNRSIPPVLKNAIDWGTRPWGKNSWAGKPGSVIGASVGTIGTAVAQSHLRSILTVVDVVLLGQPEIYFVSKPGLIDGNDDITDETTRKFLEGYLAAFDTWIGKHARNAIEKAA